MNMFGYGEDGLTLVYFCTQLQSFLSLMDDNSDPESCSIYYRASFGRRGGFGEIDAIVVASKRIYLCESKWNDRDRSEVRRIQLDDAQVRRDRVFHKLVASWREQNPSTWEDFREQNAAGFEGFKLPGAERTLSRNLWSMLGLLREHACECQNVLLYFYRSEMMDGLPLTVLDKLGNILTDYRTVKCKYAHDDLGPNFRLPTLWPEGKLGVDFQKTHCP